jgi:hypothetical protein
MRVRHGEADDRTPPKKPPKPLKYDPARQSTSHMESFCRSSTAQLQVVLRRYPTAALRVPHTHLSYCAVQ